MSLPTTSITSVDDFSPMFRGDTGNPLRPQFWIWDNDLKKYVPRDLTGLTPSLKMIDADGQEKNCTGDWTIDNELQGQAHYQWQSTDVDTVGVWTLFIALTDSDSRVVHADTRTLTIKYAP